MTTTAFGFRHVGQVGLTVCTVLIANALLVLSAKVQVPFWPVPMTMQSLVVVAIGLGLGLRLGAFAVLLYLAEGAIGLPVFAGTPERGVGLAYMAGPTGGYLVGFLLCTIVVGWFADQGRARGVLPVTTIVLGGHVVILSAGALWLGALAGWQAAWTVGILPFLFGTLVKSGLGICSAASLERLRCKFKSQSG